MTGVQTCALPISPEEVQREHDQPGPDGDEADEPHLVERLVVDGHSEHEVDGRCQVLREPDHRQRPKEADGIWQI